MIGVAERAIDIQRSAAEVDLELTELPILPIDDDLRRRAERIEWIVLDVDGVLTDGSILLDDSGNEIKRFNVRDGFGIRCWLHRGFHAAIITGRTSNAVVLRANDLGIEVVEQGARDKLPAFRRLCDRVGVSPDHVGVIGDDLPDGPILELAGLSAAPADAHPAVLERVDLRLARSGGRGAVREWIELLLESKGLWSETLERYRLAEPSSRGD